MATSSNANVEEYRTSWQDEIESAALYRVLAEAETQPLLAQVYRRLAETEEAHARFWEEKLRAANQPVPPRRLRWRTRTLMWLARRFGPSFVVPTLAAEEATDSHLYSRLSETRGSQMAAEEQSHQRLLRTIARSAPQGVEGSVLARIEGRHRSLGGNALRAAVLGANDGLVSNLSLIMGVAGAELSSRNILVTGFAGLLAGAISMALGEWLSVQSSRELYERQIAIERRELEQIPEEEEEELALIYQAKGLNEVQAKTLAARLMADQATALDTLSREELGIDPEELGGSAWEAAIASFALFAIGAIVPILPFIVLDGFAAVIGSGIISAIGLFGIGAGITLMTGRSLWYSGLRQVLFGLLAAAVTYAIGSIVGVSLGG
ncbi:MAG TPA: VIT1/CCC1 transporter family protein [Caldilineaceae bacterium]|nr:VIT1/CCC1 transporter family protein [Caldilineaceae bacterium]